MVIKGDGEEQVSDKKVGLILSTGKPPGGFPMERSQTTTQGKEKRKWEISVKFAGLTLMYVRGAGLCFVQMSIHPSGRKSGMYADIVAK